VITFFVCNHLFFHAFINNSRTIYGFFFFIPLVAKNKYKRNFCEYLHVLALVAFFFFPIYFKDAFLEQKNCQRRLRDTSRYSFHFISQCQGAGFVFANDCYVYGFATSDNFLGVEFCCNFFWNVVAKQHCHVEGVLQCLPLQVLGVKIRNILFLWVIAINFVSRKKRRVVETY